jgi:hypothetical protein
MTEVTRVEVYDLLDDALAISILKLRRGFEKIKPGMSERHISHDVGEI